MIDKTLAFGVIGIVALLVGAGSFAYTSSVVGGLASQDQIDELKSSIAKSTSDIDSLRSQITSGETRLAEAEGVLEAAKAEAAFIAAAKAEAQDGDLIIYGSMDAPDMIKIMWPSFKAKYPFVGEVAYIEGFGSLMKRFQEEAQRGARTADVRIDGSERAFLDMALGLPGELETNSDELYEPGQIIQNKLRNGYLIPGAIFYNTDLVSAADAPKSWAALGDPEWKGKILFADPRLGTEGIEAWAHLVEGLGEEKAKELARGIFIDNEAVPADTYGTTAYNKVLSGEFAISAGLINDVVQQPAGAPVGYSVPEEGVTVTTSWVYTFKDTPKPNLAKLFITWYLSPEGQTQIAITGRTPSLATLQGPGTLQDQVPGAKLMLIPESYFFDPDSWRVKLIDLFKEAGLP